MINKETFRLKILYYTLMFEGGYCNVEGDRGGETYRGISKVANPDWWGWSILSKLKPSKGDIINDPSLKDAVTTFYFDKYFTAQKFDALTSEMVALNLFDWYVNGGYAVKRLQTLLLAFDNTLVVDGVMGGKTILAINNAPAQELCKAVIALRQERFNDIVERNPSQEKFADGWANRLNALKKILKG